MSYSNPSTHSYSNTTTNAASTTPPDVSGSERDSSQRSESDVQFVFTFYDWKWKADKTHGDGAWVREFSVARGDKVCDGYVRVEGSATDQPRLTDESTRSKVRYMICQGLCVETQWAPDGSYLSVHLCIEGGSPIRFFFGVDRL
jgi:hypothetical protein